VIRVVVDTNILVSGVRTHKGNEAKVIDAVRGSVLRLCLSEVIFLEYVDVLFQPKFAFLTDEVAELLSTIRKVGEFFEPNATILVVSDQSDAKFMACAMTALADYLVTGNRRHFPNPFYGSARVVNARALLGRITPNA
jgi:uncharacterized protein